MILPMKLINHSPNRITVKVGTSSLVSESGALDVGRIRNLAGQLSAIYSQGKELILVSSGAIKAGMDRLGLTDRPRSIAMLQAASAVGQGELMRVYTEVFSSLNMTAAQILLTRDDFRNRGRYLNGRKTMMALLKLGCTPIVNENDTVAVDEIKFGENDTLAALVAACVDSDLLINLSDVDGLYDGDPRKDSGSKLIEEVKEITPQIEALAGNSGDFGSGGMRSKIEAAKIAVNSGVRMVIADASRENVIVDIVNGKRIGTRFLSSPIELNHRKRWIAFGDRPRGSLIINSGAIGMLTDKGKSLLSAGIIACEGDFREGDMVSIINEFGDQIAKGLTNYSCSEINQIMGKRSSEIERILGYKEFDEVIHRDNMVLGV